MKAIEKTWHWREFVSKRVIHHAKYPTIEDRDVVLLAVVQCWAMVRRPKAMPYVCHIAELRHRP